MRGMAGEERGLSLDVYGMRGVYHCVWDEGGLSLCMG